MPIKKNITGIEAICVGSSKIIEIRKGTELVYSGAWSITLRFGEFLTLDADHKFAFKNVRIYKNGSRIATISTFPTTQTFTGLSSSDKIRVDYSITLDYKSAAGFELTSTQADGQSVTRAISMSKSFSRTFTSADAGHSYRLSFYVTATETYSLSADITHPDYHIPPNSTIEFDFSIKGTTEQFDLWDEDCLSLLPVSIYPYVERIQAERRPNGLHYVFRNTNTSKTYTSGFALAMRSIKLKSEFVRSN